MDKDYKDVLDALKQIDDLIQTFPTGVQDGISTVLTALRGPDFYAGDANEIKATTTAIIRYVALPKLATSNSRLIAGAWFGRLGLYEEDTSKYSLQGCENSHFAGHVIRAAAELGLVELKKDLK